MDKVKLNEEQIDHLKEFIKTKGFHDHAVILEILDHFACKIEDIMTNEPKMSFYDALMKARLSFGVMGFQPISSAFEKQSRKKYRKLYWRNLFQSFTSIKFLILLDLSGYVSYELWLLFERKNFKHIFELNDIFFLVLLFWAAFKFVLRKTLPDKGQYFSRLAYFGEPMLPFFSFCILPDAFTKHHLSQGGGIITCVVTVYMIVMNYAYYTTLKKAVEDDKEIERFYKTA